MKPTYRIKDWDAHFETAESRKLNKTRWVPMPTKQDGKGYRRIAQHEDSVAIFCAWNLIVQVASKMPTRGLLVDEDGPLDADDLSVKTGFPAAIFATALNVLASDRIGWMATEVQGKKPRAARVRQGQPEIPASPATSSPEGKGKERNSIEEKGKEDSVANATGASAAPQIPKGVSTVDFTIWKMGVGKLMDAGVEQQAARSFLGEQCKAYGKEPVAAAVTAMLAQEPAEPKAYIVAVLQGKNGTRHNPSKVDRSMENARQVIEEYERGN